MKREFIGVLQAWGAQGSMFGSRQTVSVGTSATSYLAEGAWFVETDANSTVKGTYDGGTTFVTMIAASSAGVVPSDGFTVAVVGGSAPGTAHKTQVFTWQ
jgi:hypothetical protein